MRRRFEKITFLQFKKDIEYLNPIDDQASIMYEMFNLPKRSTAKSAGYDVEALYGFVLHPGEEILLPTGFKVEMHDDEMINFYPRSSHGFKFYIRLANTVGIGDADYFNNEGNEGHYWVKLRNEGTKTLTVEQGDKICQGIFAKYLLTDDDSFEGEERTGGFGSTDAK